MVMQIRGPRVLIGLILGCVQLLVLSAPLHASLTLNSSLAVTETYTDNLFFESQRNKRDDFGTFVIPSLNLTYRTKDVVLSGTYSGVAQFYVNNTNANAYTHNANFGIDLPFLTKRYKGLEIRLIESFNFTPAIQGYSFAGDASDQDTPLPGQQGQNGANAGGGLQGGGIAGLGTPIGNQGVFTGRGTNSFQNTAGINVRYSLSPRWIPNARYTNNYVRFTDSDLNDSLTHNLGAGVSYVVSARTSLNVNYSAGISDIRRGDTVVTHNITGGVSHTVSPTINFNANAGVSFTESAERVTFTTNSQITKAFNRGSMSLRYNQGITTGGGLSQSGVLTQTGAATVSYPFTERVNGFAAAGISKNKSLSGNVVDVISYTGQVGLSAPLLSWLSGNISYSYIKQKSKGSAVGGRSAVANQGFIGLTARIPAWRIVR
ncbi:MAG: hypothetical protein ACPGYT_11365 [Nitrospirales bacterium]